MKRTISPLNGNIPDGFKPPIVMFMLPIDDIEVKVHNFWPLQQTLLP